MAEGVCGGDEGTLGAEVEGDPRRGHVAGPDVLGLELGDVVGVAPLQRRGHDLHPAGLHGVGPRDLLALVVRPDVVQDPVGVEVRAVFLPIGQRELEFSFAIRNKRLPISSF